MQHVAFLDLVSDKIFVVFIPQIQCGIVSQSFLWPFHQSNHCVILINPTIFSYQNWKANWPGRTMGYSKQYKDGLASLLVWHASKLTCTNLYSRNENLFKQALHQIKLQATTVLRTFGTTPI